MADITRFDPFSGNLDDLFKGFFVRPVRFGLDAPQDMPIRIDVSRADGGYKVRAEMPGVKKEDINVTIDGSEVTLSGEVRRETEEKKGEEVIRSEGHYGKVVRSFTLPYEIDDSRVAAKYSDGVLQLTLPTKEKSSAKKVAVN